MGHWKNLYGESETRNVGHGIHHFIRVIPRDEFPDGYEYRYNVSGCEVDLWSLSRSCFEDAFASCGPDGFSATEWEQIQAGDVSGSKGEVLAEFCYSHGSSAPVYEAGGNNLRQLLRAARRALHLVVSDQNERLNVLHGRPVNRIGSTAFQYMRGSLFCYGQMPARMQWNYRRMKSADPIAFSMGFSHGLYGHPLEVATRGKLSPEYLRGYRAGSEASYQIHRNREPVVFPEGIHAG